MKISDAIKSKSLLRFAYRGFPRTVEPHTFGLSRKGQQWLSAYQVEGGSESGEFFGWKIFQVDEIEGLVVLPKQFAGPREGYKRFDSRFSDIYAQI